MASMKTYSHRSVAPSFSSVVPRPQGRTKRPVFVRAAVVVSFRYYMMVYRAFSQQRGGGILVGRRSGAEHCHIIFRYGRTPARQSLWPAPPVAWDSCLRPSCLRQAPVGVASPLAPPARLPPARLPLPAAAPRCQGTLPPPLTPLQRGYKVRALGRSADKLQQLFGDAQGLTPVLADLRDPASLPAAIDGADAVACCTGTTAFPSKRWDGGNGPEQTDFVSVRNLVRAVAARPAGSIKRMVLTTSIGVERAGQLPFSILNLFGGWREGRRTGGGAAAAPLLLPAMAVPACSCDPHPAPSRALPGSWPHSLPVASPRRAQIQAHGRAGAAVKRPAVHHLSPRAPDRWCGLGGGGGGGGCMHVCPQSQGTSVTLCSTPHAHAGPYTSYDINTLLRNTSGSRQDVQLSLADDLSGEASRIVVAEAIVQSLMLQGVEGRAFAIASREGNGPGTDPATWAALYGRLIGSAAAGAAAHER